MAQKLSDVLKTATRTSYVKSSVKQAVSKMGMDVSRQVSERRAKEILGELKKSGAVKTYRSPTQIFRETEKELRAGQKEDGPKITVASLREERKAEDEKKERMRKMMTNIYGQERAREEEKEKGDGKVKRNVATSALKPKAAPGRAETTTSILRSQKSAADKTAPEEKPPQAIDLQID
ncbi:MAG: hypothetical protein WC348_03805 [Patescibacteria group bacterium]|jgi:hypothetical protein